MRFAEIVILGLDGRFVLLVAVGLALLAIPAGLHAEVGKASARAKDARARAAWDDELRSWAASQGRTTKPCPVCRQDDVPIDAAACFHCGFRFR